MSNAPGHWLAIDASAPRSAVVLVRVETDGSHALVGGDDRVDGANQASQTLDHRIREALAQAEIEVGQLAGLACGRGPGTFTGTRVAVATMQGLAIGLGLPVLPLGTLEVLAHGFEAPTPGATVLPLLDARRQEVYAQAFTVSAAGALEARGEPACRALAEVLAELAIPPEQLQPVGPGVVPYADALPAHARPNEGPTREALARTLAWAWRTRDGLPPHELQALYLRKTYAELGLNKPKRPVFRNPLLDA